MTPTLASVDKQIEQFFGGNARADGHAKAGVIPGSLPMHTGTQAVNGAHAGRHSTGPSTHTNTPGPGPEEIRK